MVLLVCFVVMKWLFGEMVMVLRVFCVDVFMKFRCLLLCLFKILICLLCEVVKSYLLVVLKVSLLMVLMFCVFRCGLMMLGVIGIVCRNVWLLFIVI